MEQFVGNPCVRSFDVHLRKKARRPCLILIGLIISTKEANKLDFKITRTPTTFSCIFAPFKGIQEESCGKRVRPFFGLVT